MYLVPAEKYSEAPKKHSPPTPEDPNTHSLYLLDLNIRKRRRRKRRRKGRRQKNRNDTLTKNGLNIVRR